MQLHLRLTGLTSPYLTLHYLILHDGPYLQHDIQVAGAILGVYTAVSYLIRYSSCHTNRFTVLYVDNLPESACPPEATPALAIIIVTYMMQAVYTT